MSESRTLLTTTAEEREKGESTGERRDRSERGE